MQVAILLADGICNKQIAYRLKMAENTVETHRSRLMERLGVNNLAGITRYVIALEDPISFDDWQMKRGGIIMNNTPLPNLKRCCPDWNEHEGKCPYHTCPMCGDTPCGGCNKCCGSKLGRDPDDGSCLGCG